MLSWGAEFLSYAMAASLTNFELTIEKLVYGGEGLGQDHSGADAALGSAAGM